MPQECSPGSQSEIAVRMIVIQYRAPRLHSEISLSKLAIRDHDTKVPELQSEIRTICDHDLKDSEPTS